MSRPTRVTIDLKALTDNAQALRKQAGNRKFMAVVKADAYGHGAPECADALSEHVDAFAVAITEEALALRSAGIEQPILVLQGPHSADDLEAAGADTSDLGLGDETTDDGEDAPPTAEEVAEDAGLLPFVSPLTVIALIGLAAVAGNRRSENE